MAMIVKQFKDQYTFLSNFYPTYLEIGGKVFPTVEHAYQAAKTTDRDWQGKIMQAQTPGQAKKIGRQAPMREDWDEIKIELMRGLVYLKFAQNAQLQQQLIKTEDAILEEGNSWGDTFWGIYEGEGENNLGLILMEVRAMLRAQLTVLFVLD